VVDFEGIQCLSGSVLKTFNWSCGLPVATPSSGFKTFDSCCAQLLGDKLVIR
jgi:hypothetical protein